MWLNTRSVRPSISLQACAKNPGGHNFDELPPIHRHHRHEFARFDGSKPLLPPWRPESLEAEFNYSARRVESRERGADRVHRKIVKVEKLGFATMFAEVVQEIDDGKGRIWLRPLLMDSHGQDGFVDLRGATDVVLEKTSVSDVDSETKLRLSVNLMATEEDVVGRVVSDENWDKVSTNAVLLFLKKLSEDSNTC